MNDGITFNGTGQDRAVVQMDPRHEVQRLISKAEQARRGADQAFSKGIHTQESSVMGDFAVRAIVPRGYKGLARGFGRSAKRSQKETLTRQWMDHGYQIANECHQSLSKMSINSKTLPKTGNSDRLCKKLNRAGRCRTPVSFFRNLIEALREVATLDLLWNDQIPLVLEKRRFEKEQQRHLKKAKDDIPPGLIESAKTVRVYNQGDIAGRLSRFPQIKQNLLGGIGCLREKGPDSPRHCLISCRSAIESICIEVGQEKDWKKGLNKIFKSETDRRAVKGVIHYLSGKVHGGHDPIQSEAELGVKLTVAMIENIIGKCE